MPTDPLPVPPGTDRAPVVQVWARDGVRTELSPGALDMLRLLEPGRDLELVRGDGRRDRWRVSRVEASEAPAARDVIAVDDDRGELTLLVCGGAYLPQAGGYERPILLRCTPVGRSPAAAA